MHKGKIHEAGARLALRAFGIGSLFAFGGVGFIAFSIWKLSGAKDFAQFRQRAGGILPEIPKSENPKGRTEFSGLTDLLQYIIDEDEKEKAVKRAKARLQKDKTEL